MMSFCYFVVVGLGGHGISEMASITTVTILAAFFKVVPVGARGYMT